MNREELLWFRDNIAIPKMQQLLQNTTIPEGYCCITSLDISILDGRSCGVDSILKAEGLLFRNGKVEPYSFETYDFESTDFFQSHASSIFLSDGKLHVTGELEEMEINTVLRNLDTCAGIFPELKPAASMNIERTPLEYLKMQKMLEDAKKAELNAKIDAILAKRGEHRAPPKSEEQKDDLER